MYNNIPYTHFVSTYQKITSPLLEYAGIALAIVENPYE